MVTSSREEQLFRATNWDPFKEVPKNAQKDWGLWCDTY